MYDNGNSLEKPLEVTEAVRLIRRQRKSFVIPAACDLRPVFIVQDHIIGGNRFRDLCHLIFREKRRVFGEHVRDRFSQAGIFLRAHRAELVFDPSAVLELCLKHIEHIRADPVLLVHILHHDRYKAEQGHHERSHDRKPRRAPLHHCGRISLPFLFGEFLPSDKPLHAETPGDQAGQHHSGKQDLADDISDHRHLLIFYRIAAKGRIAQIFDCNGKADILLSVACTERERLLLQVFPGDSEVPEPAVFCKPFCRMKDRRLTFPFSAVRRRDNEELDVIYILHRLHQILHRNAGPDIVVIFRRRRPSDVIPVAGNFSAGHKYLLRSARARRHLCPGLHIFICYHFRREHRSKSFRPCRKLCFPVLNADHHAVIPQTLSRILAAGDLRQ